MARELQYFFRSLRREWLHWGFAIAILGVGVGSTTAIYSLMDALVFEPLPIEDQDRVVSLGGLAFELPGRNSITWWGQAQSLEKLALLSIGEPSLQGEGSRKLVRVCVASSEFFAVFGVRMVQGRGFGPADELSGQSSVAVISHAFSRSHFGRQESALGKEMRLNRMPYVVVGVAPPGFAYPVGTDIWVPRPRNPKETLNLSQNPSMGWVGRLRDGASLSQSKAELNVLLNQLNTIDSPKSGIAYGEFVVVENLRSEFARPFEPTMKALFVGAVLIMLVAAVNSCLFFLGRAAKRRKEIAIRRALGASPGAILKQCLLEASLFGLLCGLAGLLIADGLLTISQSFIPAYLSHVWDRTLIGPGLLLASAGTATVIGILAGLIPALHSLNPQVTAALLGGECALLTDTRGKPLRHALVVLEVSLSFVLTLSALLALRTSLKLTAEDPGYEANGLYAVHVSIPSEEVTGSGLISMTSTGSSLRDHEEDNEEGEASSGSNDDLAVAAIYARHKEIMGSLAAAPGVTVLGATDALPVWKPRGGIFVKRKDELKWCPLTLVAGDYFAALRIGVVAGQPLSESGANEVVISELLSRQLWRGENPIGDSLLLDGEDQPRQVVGVVRDTRSLEIDERAAPRIYLPFKEPYRGILKGISMYLLVRCQEDCSKLFPAFIQELKRVGADPYVDRAASVNEFAREVAAPAKARATVLSSYAMVGASLAFAGVFLLVSYVAATRKGELGIRMALGAEPADLVYLVIKSSVVSTVIGLFVGAGASLGTTQVMRSLIFGITPLDPASFALASAILVTGSALASVIPAAWVVRHTSGSAPLRVI